MLRSMTGFGRCLLENPAFSQEWEIRSVNGKHLDIKWRLPSYARYLEPRLEKLVRARATRGRVEISLNLRFASGGSPDAALDEGKASAMLERLENLAAARGDEFSPDYNILLSAPELWGQAGLEDDPQLEAALEEGLGIALDDWNEARSGEGEALGEDLWERLTLMEQWTATIAERAPDIKEDRAEAMRERLTQALAESGATLDENRFFQEIAILADRLDVSEELTRLSAHLERMRALLRRESDAGRRLDFTLQECFREINTCGNKIADAQLSRVVVDFKNELEKCREQAQNLE